ncbi:hypothetical protein H5410_031120 [Solanum commersonii]|uniref:DUF7081 domain-containing protein n=1 Tax=Solanum commersonii TaxID=4109 RepID=A0A9J5YLD2_SOLCO|nr:hypothetical protein H5410_031120 [Solanum commersonii]
MSAKKEVGESRPLAVSNRNASRINETGLPYAHVDCTNVGYKWGWWVGKRVTGLGTFKDRYLYLPKYFEALKDGMKNAFELGDSFESVTKLKRLASTRIFDMKERTTSSRTEMQPLLSNYPIKVITCKAGNKICRSVQLSSLPDGEDNNYKGVGFSRKGGGGIPSLPVRDTFPSTSWAKISTKWKSYDIYVEAFWVIPSKQSPNSRDMKERTTSSRTEMQHLLSDSLIKVITYKATNNYKGVGFDREGGGGIQALPVRDSLLLACGPELAPNGRTMIYMLRPCETLH